MSYAEVAHKFRECAGFAGWPEAKSAEIIGLVRDLESVSGVDRLTALLSSQ